MHRGQRTALRESALSSTLFSRLNLLFYCVAGVNELLADVPVSASHLLVGEWAQGSKVGGEFSFCVAENTSTLFWDIAE